MPVTMWTDEEHREILDKANAAAFELAKRLARRVSRREKELGIGGFGCITEPNAESEYCCGCPAEDLCPYPSKQWPK